jgi:hypothetical protein
VRRPITARFVAVQLVKWSVEWTGWAALLTLGGGLSLRPALAIGLALLVLRAGIVHHEHVLAFRPFELIIRPAWMTILRNEGWISETHRGGGETLRNCAAAAGPKSLRLLDEGLRITFLTRDAVYVHHLDVFVSLDELDAPMAALDPSRPYEAFGLFVKSTRQGYELGCYRNEAPGSTAKNTRVVIATLPWSLVRFYFWDTGSQESVLSELAAAGWTASEQYPFLTSISIQLEHPLVSLSIRVV